MSLTSACIVASIAYFSDLNKPSLRAVVASADSSLDALTLVGVNYPMFTLGLSTLRL